jgi:tetratricopeptide (TPR) repeat protein
MSEDGNRVKANECFKNGIYAAENKDYKQAIEYFTQAIELDPKDARFYNNRGDAKFQLKQHKEAIKDYDKVIELGSKNEYPSAYINRGDAKFELKQYYEAIKDYDEVIELDLGFEELYYKRGVARFEIKQYHEAIEDFSIALGLGSPVPKYYNNRGNAKLELKQYLEAIEDYDKAIELKPEYAGAYYNRGVAYRKLGKEENALNDFQQSQTLDPTIISKEFLKESLKKSLEKYEAEKEAVEERVQEAEDFQSVLEELESEFFKNKETGLARISAGFALFTVVVMLIFIFERPSCMFSNQELSQSQFWRVSSLIAYLSTLTFYLLGQYNKISNLRIDARNRLAMAKLLYRIEDNIAKARPESANLKELQHTYTYPKLIDCIAYRIEFKKGKLDKHTVERVVEQVLDSTRAKKS